MQIGSKFTIGVHLITAMDYFKDMDRVNSEFLAGSIGVNPVIVRTVSAGRIRSHGRAVDRREGLLRQGQLRAHGADFDIHRAV